MEKTEKDVLEQIKPDDAERNKNKKDKVLLSLQTLQSTNNHIGGIKDLEVIQDINEAIWSGNSLAKCTKKIQNKNGWRSSI